MVVEGKGRRAKKVERAEEMAEARMGRERKSGEKVIKAFMMLAGGGGDFRRRERDRDSSCQREYEVI